jgi:hypothetical protein
MSASAFATGFVNDARPTGMGHAFTGVADDINAINYNPAGLAFIGRKQLLLSEWPVPVDPDFNTYSVAAALPTSFGAYGFSFSQNDYFLDIIPLDTIHLKGQKISFIYATRINERFSLGININTFNKGAFESKYFVSSWYFASSWDMGAYLQITRDLSFGLMYETVQQTPYDIDDILPEKLRVGLGYTIGNAIFAIDLDKLTKVNTGYWESHYGLEYRLTRVITLRCGFERMYEAPSYTTDDTTSTFGASINLSKNMSLDFARTNTGNIILYDTYSLKWEF